MKLFNRILKELYDTLDELELETKDTLVKAEKAIKITNESLEQVRAIVQSGSFKNTSEEIEFFKYIKPQIYSKLIYFVKLFNIESKRPRSSNKSQIKYFNNEIDKLQLYFNDNLEYYQYYRRGAIFLDDQYFLRRRANMRLHPDTFHFFVDPQFSTSRQHSGYHTCLRYANNISQDGD